MIVAMGQTTAAHGQILLGLVTLLSLLTYRFICSPVVRSLSRNLRVDHPPRSTPALMLAVLLMASAAEVTSRQAPRMAAGPLAAFILFTIAFLTVRCVCNDFDLPIRRSTQVRARWAMVLLVPLSCWVPGVLLLWVALACGPCSLWTHHAKTPVRVIKVVAAWYLAAAIVLPLRPPSVTPHAEEQALRSALLLLISAVIVSSYVKAGLKKVRLSHSPTDWITKNRTDLLFLGAHMVGRFRDQSDEKAFTRARFLEHITVLLNAGTLFIELFGLGAGLDRWWLVASLVACAALNVAIALMSEIVFFENIVVLGALALTVGLTAPAALSGSFGLIPELILLALIVLSLAGLTWHPIGPAWWDGPFRTSLIFEATTLSGLRFALPPDFWRPHARDFIKARAQALATGVPLVDPPALSLDLGLITDLIACDGDAVAFAALVDRVQTPAPTSQEADDLTTEITGILDRLNRGERKSPLAPWATWLKRPDEIAHRASTWVPPAGHDPIVMLEIRVLQRFASTRQRRIIVVTDRVVRAVPLSPVAR